MCEPSRDPSDRARGIGGSGGVAGTEPAQYEALLAPSAHTHAMHEGVLTYGDIRFGPIVQRGGLERPEPGRLTVLAGVHATYDTAPPEVRRVHGRVEEMAAMDAWADSRALCLSIHGLAGMGKSLWPHHGSAHSLNGSPGSPSAGTPVNPGTLLSVLQRASCIDSASMSIMIHMS